MVFACNRITLSTTELSAFGVRRSPLNQRLSCITKKVVCSDCLTTFAFPLVRLHFRFCCLVVVTPKVRQKMGDIFSFQGSASGLRLAFRLFPSRSTFIYYILYYRSVKGLGKNFFRLSQTGSRYRSKGAQPFVLSLSCASVGKFSNTRGDGYSGLHLNEVHSPLIKGGWGGSKMYLTRAAIRCICSRKILVAFSQN